MLFLRVLTSKLGVRWHREHLTCSSGDAISESNEECELLEELESSLETLRTFCAGTGRGLLGGRPYAEDVWACIMVSGTDGDYGEVGSVVCFL